MEVHPGTSRFGGPDNPGNCCLGVKWSGLEGERRDRGRWDTRVVCLRE